MMETILPSQVAEMLAIARREADRHFGGYRVRTAEGDLPILALTADGFVVAADDRPHLRGFVDIFRGDERVLRGLVVFAWASTGRIAYEFKRDATGRDVPVDYVRPGHTGLLEAPQGA